jgi:hypothetical protein
MPVAGGLLFTALDRLEQFLLVGVNLHGRRPPYRGTASWPFGSGWSSSGDRVLVLDERHQIHVVLASDDEDALASATLAFAHKAHIGIGSSVPASVPKPGPRTINPQPTPTKLPMKNGPEILDFRPVL